MGQPASETVIQDLTIPVNGSTGASTKEQAQAPLGELKPWQKGVPIEKINEIKQTFAHYNSFCRGPFSEINGPVIASDISDGKLTPILSDFNQSIVGYISTQIAKVRSPISMYEGVIIGYKEKGDRVINYFSIEKGAGILLSNKLKEEFLNENCWMYIWEEDPAARMIAKTAGFKKIGVKISTFSEIVGIYFRDSEDSLAERTHPHLDPIENLNIMELTNIHLKSSAELGSLVESIAKKVREGNISFTNHYSKYNVAKAWGAVALRGFTADPAFMTKPAEMNDKWWKDKDPSMFEIQDTPLRKEFPEVEAILELIDATNVERIRLMRLKAKDVTHSELGRHSDSVDKDMGLTIGKLARIHFPIITNPGVIFHSWDVNGKEHKVNMKVGEAWFLEIRKGHAVTNDGDEDRIHLVIDVWIDEKFKALLESNMVHLDK